MNAGTVASNLYAAGAARAYTGGGFTDWFLPSKDELNAMCYYSRNLSASPDPTVSCIFGTSQDGTFAIGAYGFASDIYLSSSQLTANSVWRQNLGNAAQGGDFKSRERQVRPIRAF